MPTNKPRINVTFEEATTALLSSLARKKNISVTKLVRELTLEALEMREDFYLSKIAEKTDTPNAKSHLHDDAWK